MSSRPAPPAGRERGYPFVAQAGHTQFHPGRILTFPCIQSRCVVGCHAGRGTVILNGTQYPLQPGLLYLMPWGHAISYRADAKDPFFVFGVHVIPWQGADHPLVLAAAHDRTDVLFGVEWRRPSPPGAPLPGNDVVATTEVERPSLAAFARYAIERFARGRPADAEVRALGLLLLAELDARPLLRPQDDPSLPNRFRGLLVWITRDLTRHITLADMAGVLECSPTTVTRQFGRYLGCSPMDWVIQQRMEQAKQLLTAGHDTIASVARQCGFEDPWYFSRLFKARVGTSPAQWRRHRTI